MIQIPCRNGRLGGPRRLRPLPWQNGVLGKHAARLLLFHLMSGMEVAKGEGPLKTECLLTKWEERSGTASHVECSLSVHVALLVRLLNVFDMAFGPELIDWVVLNSPDFGVQMSRRH